ncbi:hypothetical protein LTR97_011564 [Elasticomyces elasticus]|uniref:Uncharacterized protein n=1 Tax=Elasticomyces elasticus TaxID=574655 RepID=A0AAN7W248_9PEZI|nr:hypothetical protein LTR97_011564 [Elasticomyces elasticus]
MLYVRYDIGAVSPVGKWLSAGPNTQEDQVRNAYLDTLKTGVTYSSRLQVQRDDVLDILKHQQQVLHKLTSAEKACRNGQTNELPGMHELAEAVSSMEKIQAFLCQALDFDPIATQPSAGSRVAAEKVFAVPELAEMILLEAGPYTILQAMQTCKALAATITTPKLQVKLGLRGQPAGYWYSPFAENLRQLSMCMESERKGAREEINLHDLFSCNIVVPRREVEQATGTIIATVHASFDGKVRNPQGLTVGDLLRATAKARKQRQLCPYAHEYQHDRNTGFVVVHVSFEGSLQLRIDDPYLDDGSGTIGYRADSPPVKGVCMPEDEEGLRGRLREYIDYKKKAYQKGQTILTMAKFFATASERS